MPIYEYVCEDCETTSEFIFPSNSKPNKIKCNRCGGYLTKIFSAPQLSYYRMGVDPSCTTASDKWAKMHEGIK